MPRTSAVSHRVSAPIQNVNLLDCNSMLEGGDAVAAAEHLDRVQVDYPKLKEQLQVWREQQSWERADTSIALVSADTNSEGQQRFATMLSRSGFETDVSYYRDNFVSLPAGRQPADLYDKEKPQRPLVSLAARLTYALGLLARYPEPQVLIVSHAFELYWPMLNFAQRNEHARVGLAYFGSLLDYRWKHAGLLEANSPIAFLDLDEHSADLIGVDLSGRARTQGRTTTHGSGLSRL